MNDLVEFLRARLDEDEQAASVCILKTMAGRGEWTFAEMQVRNDLQHLVVKHTWPNEGEHIARHDPARVLREVEAKRRLLDGFIEMMEGDYAPWNEEYIRLLALPYANHEDYQQQWKP